MTFFKRFVIAAYAMSALFFAQANAATMVEIETSVGNITLELYPEKAPKTVANFVKYVNNGFYTNTIFHRVISGFMIQGGGFERDLTEKETREPIVNEAGNGLSNKAGTIAMARTSDPDSATSQFFINLVENPALNYTGPGADFIGYCVFGKVVQGMDVVHKIGLMPTTNSGGYANVPIRPIIIKQAKIISNK